MASVLITGASRGIGRACALRFDRRGFDVIAGVRSDEAARSLRLEASGRLRVVRLDITDLGSVRAAAELVGDRLDALVNNAGIVVGGVVETLALDDLRQQLEVNVTGQIAMTQAVLPALRSANGRIVFMSSESGRVAWPALTPYAASKFAVEAIADGLRIELRPWRVDVVLIEPGAFDTDMWRRSGPHLDRVVAAMTEQQREDYALLLSGARKLMRLTARRAAPVEKVVEVIERALTADKPKTRYVVGPDARAQIALRSLLPDRAFDAVIARAFGLK